MRNRRIRRLASAGTDAHRGAQAPRIPRLRLGRHRDEQRPRARDAEGEGQDLDARDRWSARIRSTAPSASRTRAGRRTARRTKCNAHPHTDCTNTIAVVHNGIIENYSALRKMLKMQGHTFKSETDTEVLAHLIEAAFRRAARGRGDRRAESRRRHLRHRGALEQGARTRSSARARGARSSSASATASTSWRATWRRFSSTRARSSISTTARWAC